MTYDHTNNFAVKRECCPSLVSEWHQDTCASPDAQMERTKRAFGQHSLSAQVRLERVDDCCARKEGEPHTDDCTSNEAVLGRVDLEQVQRDKMQAAKAYRKIYGDPLDRLKQLVDAGEMRAEREQTDGGTFIRFTSNRHNDVTARYGPLREPTTPAPVEIVGKDYSHKPRVRIPVRGLAEPTRKPRRWTVKAAIGRKLIALGRYLTEN